MIFETTNEQAIALIKGFIEEKQLTDVVFKHENCLESIYKDDLQCVINLIYEDMSNELCNEFDNINLDEFIEGIITNRIMSLEEHPSEEEMTYIVYEEIFKEQFKDIFKDTPFEFSIYEEVDGCVSITSINRNIFSSEEYLITRVRNFIVDELVKKASSYTFIKNIVSLDHLQKNLKIGGIKVLQIDSYNFKLISIENFSVEDEYFDTEHSVFSKK